MNQRITNRGSKCLQPNVEKKKLSQLTKVKPTQNQTQALVIFETLFSKKLAATNSYHVEKKEEMLIHKQTRKQPDYFVIFSNFHGLPMADFVSKMVS